MKYLSDDGVKFSTEAEARERDKIAKEARERRELGAQSFKVYDRYGNPQGLKFLASDIRYDGQGFIRIEANAQEVSEYLSYYYGDAFYGLKSTGLYVVTGEYDSGEDDLRYTIEKYEDWRKSMQSVIDIAIKLSTSKDNIENCFVALDEDCNEVADLTKAKLVCITKNANAVGECFDALGIGSYWFPSLTEELYFLDGKNIWRSLSGEINATRTKLSALQEMSDSAVKEIRKVIAKRTEEQSQQ